MSKGSRGDFVQDGIYTPFISRRHLKNDTSVNGKAVVTRMYERILTEMCVNRFEWDGMPDTIDLRFLEKTLFYNALSVFYFDTEYDRFMALRASGNGPINMYDNPTQFTVYGNQLFTKQLKANECVPIWANYLRVPDWDIIRIYSRRLAEADITLEINALSRRHPFVISVDNNERLSLVNAFRKVQEGHPVIFGTESFNPTSLSEKMNLLNMTVPNGSLTEMMEYKLRAWNEALSWLGIMNVNSTKRERMVTDEASGSAGNVLASRAVCLNARQEACDAINDKYGLSVSVAWRLDDNYVPDMPAISSTSLSEMNPNG